MSDRSLGFTQYPCMERIAYYRKGGFHPIHIDDVLHNRYHVVNKLGYGSYGTIWLVEDLNTGGYAALKVLVADLPEGASEVAVLRHLRQRKLDAGTRGAEGQEFVIEFLDEFKIEGPNGTHQCIVTEVLGPSISADLEDIYDDELYPVEIAKKLAAQVTRGVAYLHSCGVVHGDLHLGNILLRIPGIEHMSLQNLQAYLGEPIKKPLTLWGNKPITPTPHEPKYTVAAPKRLELIQLCLNSPEAVQIKICDFGEAFLWDGESVLTRLNTPSVYAAPEIIFHEPTSTAVDVWALAVLIHMVLSGGMPLFNSADGVKREVVMEMALTLGKLPERWWTKWEERSEYFDEDATFIADRTKLAPVSGKFFKIPADRMDGEELKDLERLVRAMVAYEVVDRISAAEIVRRTESWMSGHKGDMGAKYSKHTRNGMTRVSL